ncbi:MAG: CCA tRNA nucleotidyltransferase [Candidatus Heimdallarchaeaceae archaeon]
MVNQTLSDFEWCIKELQKHQIDYSVHTIAPETMNLIEREVLEKINQVRKIAKKLNCSIGIIGGFVRDLLLKKPSKDVDFVVFRGDLNELTNRISTELYAKIGKMSNLTLTTQVRFENNIVFEFNATRKEKYEGFSRLPKVEKGNIVDDLYRRDFTINALIMFEDKYIDIFNGTTDLQNKIIQTTREPKVVFAEDYLRMFRAVRFACSLGFQIEKKVKEGIKQNIRRILDVPHERILEELKLSLEADAKRAFDLMVELKILSTLFPEITNKKLDPLTYTFSRVYDKIGAKLDYLQTKRNVKDVSTLLSVIMMEMCSEDKNNDSEQSKTSAVTIKHKLREMKLSNKEIAKILTLAKYHSFLFKFADYSSGILEKRLFLRIVDKELDEIIDLNLAENHVRKMKKELEPIIKDLRELSKKPDLIFVKPILNGHEIQHLFGIQGQEIGELKEALRMAIMKEEIPNTKEACINYIKCRKRRESSKN